jgi:hypothetical protein
MTSDAGDIDAADAPRGGIRASDAEREQTAQSFAICTLIWAASGADGSFWPVWVLVFPLVFVLRNAWRLYGPAPELDRVQAELEHRSGGSGRRGRHRHRHRHGPRRAELP